MHTRVFAAAAVLTLVLLAIQPTSFGHDGDHRYIGVLRDAYTGPRLRAGESGADDAIRAIVALTGRLHTENIPWLLPPGTRVERVTWDDSVAEIDLTVPDVASAWRLGENDLETLTRALATPFEHSERFGGTRVRVRIGPGGEWGDLTQLLYPVAPPPPETHPDADRIPDPIFVTESDEPRIGGPTANAARQPAGALSGVTIYVSAGHGWTAGTSSWFLQRPVTLGMCEDYGNIDVINYFSAFAFNAGATVVPLRPVGWQPIEIVLDNDDPGVTFNGAWASGSSTKYYENGVTNSGVVYRTVSANATESATARYAPNITVTDFYPVYCYTIASDNRTIQTYRVKHNGGTSEVAVDHRETGNGWVWLGDYYFVAGEDNYVEITNRSNVSGFIVADAIRFGCGMGDVSRPGPNSISGYPRDEEGQRYWAESEWGQNAVGFDSSIWDGGSDDQSDNVGAGARIAREMNVVPAGGVTANRWKRAHLEFHSNAFNGGARGQICLITNTGSTTNQTTFATTLSNEFDADMLLVDDWFEHTWINRPDATLTGAYGAISTSNNSNEFDATLVEVAFHDNQLDAELLRDPRVRQAMGRACVHGIIRFLAGMSGSQVPLAFSPDTPRNVRTRDLGNGNVVVAWDTPLSDGALGDLATGYVVYQSSNGLGFGNPIVLGNVLQTTINGVAPGETRYFRVAARNNGGESMPSEVIAVRRPTTGAATVLVVNGYDRQRRDQNSLQTFTQPAAYAGLSIERQIWRDSNSFDYIIEYSQALAAAGYGFASCANEAVINNVVTLSDYEVVIWALGNERDEDDTLTPTEQTALQNYLNAGGNLFISGSDLAYDLVAQGNGTNFMQNILFTSYSADDANSYLVNGTVDGIFEGLGTFSFGVAAGARYDAPRPDILVKTGNAKVALGYVAGGGGTAATQFAGENYTVVVFGFPFETIGSPAVRNAVMDRVMTYLLTAGGPIPFDFDGDGDVDADDFGAWEFCGAGPDNTYPPGYICLEFDANDDLDVDLQDFAPFQTAFTGPGAP